MSNSSEAVIVFGREPVAGRVKTRLGRVIGADEACAVYRELLAITLRAVAAVEACRFLFLPTGDRLDPLEFPVHGFETRVQVDAGLGERMDQAFRELFAEGFERVVLLGSDCPYLSPRMVTETLVALGRAETVFIPTLDGGYVLVGQRGAARDLFSGIPWSTPEVWRLTRERVTSGGWSCSVLPVVEDIDDVESLHRWRTRPTPQGERDGARD
jgi:rSAM/selenodomain-associated transferase 1